MAARYTPPASPALVLRSALTDETERRLVAKFVASLPKEVARIATLLQQGNLQELREIAHQRINNPRLATFGLAQDLAARMLADYRGGAVSETGLIYSRFQSALSQRPIYEQLLPVREEKTEESADEIAAPADYLVEPSRAELVPVVLRGYLEDSIFHALLEAEASEQGARMTAMDSATNNAADMIDRLTLEMNRARQASITTDLMDIVGGAEALRA